MKAPEFLEAAAGHMRDRAATYDKPEGERSIERTVAAFNAITGHSVTAEQGWLFQVLLKCVRAQQGNYKSDNYEDGAAYFALMGEQASVDRMTVAEAREIERAVAWSASRQHSPAPNRWSELSLPEVGRRVRVKQSLEGLNVGIYDGYAVSVSLDKLRLTAERGADKGFSLKGSKIQTWEYLDEGNPLPSMYREKPPSEIVSSEFLFDTEQQMQHLTKSRHPVTLDTDKAFPDLAVEVKEKLFDLIVNDGWTMWTGGENPVPGKTVSALFRWEPLSMSTREADSFQWVHHAGAQSRGDIVAYKVVEEPKRIKPELGKTYSGDLDLGIGEFVRNVKFYVEGVGSAGVHLVFTDDDSARTRFFPNPDTDIRIHEEVKP